MSHHGKQEITDPVEEMLKKTGCIELHYQVQECIAVRQDWRDCQDQVAEFKICMNKHVEKQRQKKMTGLGTTKMVLIVRTDIKMGKGKIASQCAHAAISLYASALRTQNSCLKSWIYSGQPKVVLKVDKDCESTLKSLYDSATKSNLNTYLVCDAGKTQVDSGTLTVLGIGPNKIDDIDKLTNHLKLL